jgi:hypothetical protein
LEAQEARNLIGADDLEYTINHLQEENAMLKAKVDAFEQVQRDRNQVRSYRRADAHDSFYGLDADYQRWSERYSDESLQMQMVEDSAR